MKGGQFAAILGGQFPPTEGGHFPPTKGGQFQRFFHYRIILLIYFNLLIFESANDLSIPTKLILECYRKLRFEYQVHASEK
jgi:hypothetical protein